MQFSEGQKVKTKHGVGKVIYAEEDCIDVLINGREFNYLAPFENKVENHVELSDTDKIFETITKHRSGKTLIFQINKMMLIGAIVQKLKEEKITKAEGIMLLNSQESILKPLITCVDNVKEKENTITLLCECSQVEKPMWVNLADWSIKGNSSFLDQYMQTAIERIKLRFEQFKNLDHFDNRGNPVNFTA